MWVTKESFPLAVPPVKRPLKINNVHKEAAVPTLGVIDLNVRISFQSVLNDASRVFSLQETIDERWRCYKNRTKNTQVPYLRVVMSFGRDEFGGDRRASLLKFVTRFFDTTIRLSMSVTHVGEYRRASIIIILFITFSPLSRTHVPHTLDDWAKNPTLIVRKELARIFRFIYFFLLLFPGRRWTRVSGEYTCINACYAQWCVAACKKCKKKKLSN